MKELIKKLIGDKKEYREMMARKKRLPEEYRFVFERIQKYMWNFAAGDGYDMLKIHYSLIELFEEGVANGKTVLEITGKDVAAFCDDLLIDAKTYTDKWRASLNTDVQKRVGNK